MKQVDVFIGPLSRTRQPGLAQALIQRSWLAATPSLDSCGVDQSELGEFLRARRSALQPEDVGLPRGRRRRTSGLRREEVATLAEISTDYYARIERGAGPKPVGPDGHGAGPCPSADSSRARPSLRAGRAFGAGPHQQRPSTSAPVSCGCSTALPDTPAQVMSGLGVTLVQTRPAVALLGDQTRFHGPGAQHLLPLVHRPGVAPDLRRQLSTEGWADLSCAAAPVRGRGGSAVAGRCDGAAAARLVTGVCGTVERAGGRADLQRDQALQPSRGRSTSSCTVRRCSIPTSGSRCWCSPRRRAPKAMKNSRCSPCSATRSSPTEQSQAEYADKAPLLPTRIGELTGAHVGRAHVELIAVGF